MGGKGCVWLGQECECLRVRLECPALQWTTLSLYKCYDHGSGLEGEIVELDIFVSAVLVTWSFPPVHSLLSDIISGPWSSLVVTFLQIYLRHQTYIFITKTIWKSFFPFFQETEEERISGFFWTEQSWNGNRKTLTICRISFSKLIWIVICDSDDNIIR